MPAPHQTQLEQSCSGSNYFFHKVRVGVCRQGALAVQVRGDDTEAIELVSKLNDEDHYKIIGADFDVRPTEKWLLSGNLDYDLWFDSVSDLGLNMKYFPHKNMNFSVNYEIFLAGHVVAFVKDSTLNHIFDFHFDRPCCP